MATEDEIGKKWDRCFADAVFKLGGGLFLGSVFSLLFVRRKWPLIVGGGFGLGMAYSNCQKDINATIIQSVSAANNKPLSSATTTDKTAKH